MTRGFGFDSSAKLLVNKQPTLVGFSDVADLGRCSVQDFRWSEDGEWILLIVHAKEIHPAFGPGLIAVEVATGDLCIIPGRFLKSGQWEYPIRLGESFDWYDASAK